MGSPQKTTILLKHKSKNESNQLRNMKKPPRNSNLSKGEQKAVKDLQERADVVIVNVIKRGAGVTMDVTENSK